MHADTKAKWCAALRSGDYQQGRRVLCDNEGKMCCLGVLYDIVNGNWSESPHGKQYKRTDKGWHGYLGADLLRSLDITNEQEEDLVVKNDTGATFNEIADWIEQNL